MTCSPFQHNIPKHHFDITMAGRHFWTREVSNGVQFRGDESGGYHCILTDLIIYLLGISPDQAILY